MFNPEVELSGMERAHLVQLSRLPGFHVLQRLMRAEADKFILALINVDAADDAAVLAAHKMSKAAAQFFTAVTQRMNEELSMFQNTPRDGDVVEDVTENLIDLGERAGDDTPTFVPILEEMINAREL